MITLISILTLGCLALLAIGRLLPLAKVPEALSQTLYVLLIVVVIVWTGRELVRGEYCAVVQHFGPRCAKSLLRGVGTLSSGVGSLFRKGQSFTHILGLSRIDIDLNYRDRRQNDREHRNPRGRTPAEKRLVHNVFPFLIGGGLVFGVCFVIGAERAIRRGVDRICCVLFVAGQCALLSGILANYW